MTRYVDQQLAHNVKWIGFMAEIDQLLAQNYTLQDVPTKQGLGPNALKDIV